MFCFFLLVVFSIRAVTKHVAKQAEAKRQHERMLAQREQGLTEHEPHPQGTWKGELAKTGMKVALSLLAGQVHRHHHHHGPRNDAWFILGPPLF